MSYYLREEPRRKKEGIFFYESDPEYYGHSVNYDDIDEEEETKEQEKEKREKCCEQSFFVKIYNFFFRR